MRILVVEDEIKAAEYLQQGLIECGYTVDCVSDGLDGFHLALQNDYDIVLLDESANHGRVGGARTHQAT